MYYVTDLIFFQSTKEVHDRRRDEIDQYQQLLIEIEVWLRQTTETLAADVELTTESQIQDVITSHQRSLQDIKAKEIKLAELQTICSELQKYPDVQPLASVLLEQLTSVRLMLIEASKLVQTRYETLQVWLIKFREQEQRIKDAPVSMDENTLDSSPMPEEEVVVERKKLIEMETQTGRSLSSPLVEEPKTKDVSISCHVPKEAQVQTSFTSTISDVRAPPDVGIQTSIVSTTTSEVIPATEIAIQTSAEEVGKERIQILQTISEGGHETIQFSTQPLQVGEIEQQPLIQDPDDLMIEAKYRDRQPLGDVAGIKSSELNIVHSMPQSFEATYNEPDQTTTEVIVDEDGTKRIIVRKMHRTVVSRQQRVQQQQLTTMSTLTEGDVPLSQTYSQVSYLWGLWYFECKIDIKNLILRNQCIVSINISLIFETSFVFRCVRLNANFGGTITRSLNQKQNRNDLVTSILVLVMQTA